MTLPRCVLHDGARLLAAWWAHVSSWVSVRVSIQENCSETSFLPAAVTTAAVSAATEPSCLRSGTATWSCSSNHAGCRAGRSACVVVLVKKISPFVVVRTLCCLSPSRAPEASSKCRRGRSSGGTPGAPSSAGCSYAAETLADRTRYSPACVGAFEVRSLRGSFCCYG